ncbi:MAG: hypothetical protein NWF00_03685 [Candidatus Bathyarchaeota archaeon]|nr:hypothetical protein [Candidatus Bathyarchaeota archaeon]
MNMAKKVSLELSDETYKQLSDLGAVYKQNIKQTLATILKSVGDHQNEISSLNYRYGQTNTLEMTLLYIFATIPLYSTCLTSYLKK